MDPVNLVLLVAAAPCPEQTKSKYAAEVVRGQLPEFGSEAPAGSVPAALTTSPNN